MRPAHPARTPGRPSGAAQTRRARLPPAPPTATPAGPGGSEPPNPGPARGAPSHPGCARDRADEEWSGGRPAALPCRSDAASARHSKRRMLGPELRVSEVSPGLRLRPQSRFSRFGSRAFKEPSAPGEVRPRPASVSTKRSPRSRGCPRPGSAGPFCPLSPLRSLMLSEAAPGRRENAGTLLGPVLQGPSSPPPGLGAAPGNQAPTGSRLLPRRRDRPETGPSYLLPVVDVLSASICWASPA